MNYDELIAVGAWSGQELTVKARVVEYVVDGNRLGGLELETRTGSPNDIFMVKRIAEIATAADVLARLGYDRVELFSLDAHGKPLESPDLDCRLTNGQHIGIEVADVVATDAAQGDANRSKLEMTIADRIDADPNFAAAFGGVFLMVNLNGIGALAPTPISSRKELLAITGEIEVFIGSGDHLAVASQFYQRFPPKYPMLHARHAEFHASPIAGGPHISVDDGPTTIGRAHQLHEVIRVLDKHRQQAAKYRKLPTWIVLSLLDPFEHFYDTIGAAQKAQHPINPFKRAFLRDPTGRLEEI